MRCKTCSGAILQDGKCHKCGRSANAIVSPYWKKSETHHKEKTEKGPIKICRCCGHEKRCWSDGLCSKCLSRVNGTHGKFYPAGSPEREIEIQRMSR